MKNTLLALILSKSQAVPDLKVDCVPLPVGPLAPGSDFSVYFPLDALMTLGSAHAAPSAFSAASLGGVVALVGQHGCVGPLQSGAASMQAHVMLAGHAYCVDWTPVRDDPARYAHWLWFQTSSLQRLLGQMAQWSFCAQHHTPVQSLSSWLLQCWALRPDDGLTLCLNALPQPVRQWADLSQEGAKLAPAGAAFEVRDGCVRVLSAPALAALACACHAQMPSQWVTA